MKPWIILFAYLLLFAPAISSASDPRSVVDGKAATGAESAPTSAIAVETEQRKISLRRTVASGLREEAHSLQQKGQLRDAVIRYRQSLAWWPDEGLEAYLEPLEKKAGFDVRQYRPEMERSASGETAAGKAAGKAGRLLATVRNRSAQDVIILTQGETPDAGTLVRAGEILVRSVPLAANGEMTFQAVRNGQTLAARLWRGNPDSASVVPVLLYDDKLQGRLIVMTGLR